jgi:hypothetical protein
VIDMESWSDDRRLELMERVGPALGIDLSGMGDLAALLRKKHRNPTEIIAANKLKRSLTRDWFQAGEAVEHFIKDGSFEELKVAIDSGLVRVRDTKPGTDLDLVEWFVKSAAQGGRGAALDATQTDLMVEVFVDLLAGQLTSGDGYMMVDKDVASLIEALIREGRVTVSAGTRSRNTQAMTASGLLARLPSFPSASMCEVLDIREALASPSIRFRSEMVTLSRQFEASGFEGGFTDELHDAWTEKVEPALREIEEAIEENRLRTLYPANTFGAGTLPGLGIVTYGLGTGHGLVDLLGVGATAVAPALKSLWQQSVAHRHLKVRPFYFLHLTEELLAQ